jgi:hypothetical protein
MKIENVRHFNISEITKLCRARDVTVSAKRVKKYKTNNNKLNKTMISYKFSFQL